MSAFTEMMKNNHEQVVYGYDQDTGLKAIIAIHNTILGPALGGTRMWTYASEEEALKDVLRLSRGMTYKAAVAGLNLGGGKAVIIGDPRKEKSEVLFRAFGRLVEGLHGRYITAEDVGTDVRDMENVRVETDYVTGISVGLGGGGDPSLRRSGGERCGARDGHDPGGSGGGPSSAHTDGRGHHGDPGPRAARGRAPAATPSPRDRRVLRLGRGPGGSRGLTRALPRDGAALRRDADQATDDQGADEGERRDRAGRAASRRARGDPRGGSRASRSEAQQRARR